MPIEVLVVDDDITMRHLLVLQLDKLGYKADSAFNGMEAVRRVHDYEYQLILMDLQMPEMDGYEATAAIRAYERSQGRNPAVIVAVSCNPDEMRSLDIGMQDSFRKPLSMKELESLMSRYLPRRCPATSAAAPQPEL